jgi:hypothetical protein
MPEIKNQEPRCQDPDQDAKIQRIKAKENQESKKEYKKYKISMGLRISETHRNFRFVIYLVLFSLYFFVFLLWILVLRFLVLA